MSTDKNFDHNQLHVNHEEDKQKAALDGATKPDPSANPDILRRPRRKKRRDKVDSGLPSDEELNRLAQAYLEQQRMHWPDMAQAGILPEPSDAVVSEMREDFKYRHRGGVVAVETVRGFTKFCTKLGGNYNRFSTDNSNPLSIVDQMTNVLRKAREDDWFIPWDYVYCDYAVTGMDSKRQGYSSYKEMLKDEEHLIGATFVDDFTRPSRDELEWWKLAHQSKKLGKEMFGASDGFDLGSPNWDVWITIYALLSRLFIKGTQQKVRRGMKGGASRGACLGKLALGFTRQVCRDESGNVVLRANGKPRHKRCIDPVTSPYRLEMFELYVNRSWSLGKIARHFNSLKVDGSNGWTSSSIKKLLLGSDAIGIFIWNRQRRERDHDTGKYSTIKNPESEWVTYEDPELAIVPKELWDAAQEKLKRVQENHPLTGKKWSRNQKSATTLFSGTLFCQYCKTELGFSRSTDKYKSMACPHGPNHAHGCKLTTSKSTTIIENCLLGYVENFLFTEEVVKDLVQRANVFFAEEARKPQVDTAPMKAEVRKKQAAIKKLVKRIESELDESLCDGYHSRIKELQAEVNRLNEAIRKAEVHNGRPLKPLDLKQVKAYLTNLRATLNQEIPMAAEAIRTLTGPIKIRQEKIPGKRGARWIASFTPDLLALLEKVAGEKGSSLTKSFKAAPSDLKPVEVFVEEVTKYEELAPKFKQMRDDGASVQAIASEHKISWSYTKQILDFADTGKRPDWGSDKRKNPKKKAKESDTPTVPGFGKPAKYIEIAPEVSRLRKQKISFAKIATKLCVGENTVRRAYDHLHPKAAREAIENGTQSKRGSYSHLGEKAFRKIRKLLRAGAKAKEIARKVDCSESTVYRVRREMNADS